MAPKNLYPVRRPSFALATATLALVIGLLAIFPPVGVAAPQQEVPQQEVPQQEVPQRGVALDGGGLQVGAAAWVVVDQGSGEMLLGEAVDERLPMASTTKIMTLLVALGSGVDLDAEVTVSENAASYAQPTYSNIGLREGDELSVRELLFGVMVASGNDATYALAEHIGGGSAERFVDQMNARADELGLANTQFRNPEGLDEDGHYTTARDLAIMTRAGMEDRLFRELAATAFTTVTTQDRELPVSTSNDLLAVYPAATGVKTGTTNGAGATFVGSAEQEDESYIAVVLDSEGDRFVATQEMLDYAFSRYDRAPVVSQGEAYADAPMPYRRGEVVRLTAAQSVEGLLDTGETGSMQDTGSVTDYRVSLDTLPDAAESGEPVGEVQALVDGAVVGSSPLVVGEGEGYEEASIWRRLWYTVEGIWE